MNKKSIISIFVILLALSLTLGAVSAEEVASDDVVAVDGVAAGGDESVDAVAESDAAADLGTDVEVEEFTDDGGIVWSVAVTNYGPDVAENAVAYVNVADGLVVYDYVAYQGTYDESTGIWDIGDLSEYSIVKLFLLTYAIDDGEGPYYVAALAVSDTPDPDLSDNYDIAILVEDSVAEETSEETLPEAGNPLAMALLALLAVGVGGFRRRF